MKEIHAIPREDRIVDAEVRAQIYVQTQSWIKLSVKTKHRIYRCVL